MWKWDYLVFQPLIIEAYHMPGTETGDGGPLASESHLTADFLVGSTDMRGASGWSLVAATEGSVGAREHLVGHSTTLGLGNSFNK